tara:strand:+ start:38727 stop:39137 length:411 start_codon:yes stop_codon:yes gene_type:complete
MLTNCSIDKNDDTPEEITIAQWNLTHVSGGIAGVDIDFELGEIIWVFDEYNGVLSIGNTNTDNTLEDGLDSGEYSFFFTEDAPNVYITISGTERGSITVSEDQKHFILNQNETLSGGTGADGFIYEFEKTTVTVEI